MAEQVFKSDDPLDSKDFNPVDYINSIFPTEQVNFLKYFINLAYLNGLFAMHFFVYMYVICLGKTSFALFTSKSLMTVLQKD